MKVDKSKEAVKIFDKYAKLYQSKYMDVERYADILDLFCQHISDENPQVLELACGPGNVTKYLMQRRPDFKILGMDLAPKMIELARMHNPQCRFLVEDVRSIGQLEDKYHGIIAGFCLPYLSKKECGQLIVDAARILLPGGVLYLSTMEDEYSKSDYTESSSTKEKMFIHYHESAYLLEFLKHEGFQLIELVRKKYVDGENKSVTDLCLLGQKN